MMWQMFLFLLSCLIVITKLDINGSAVATGGKTMCEFNGALTFIVYSTLKIITAAPVTDTDGNVKCGTSSSWNAPGYLPRIQPTWANINSNAEMYVGGSAIVGVPEEPTSSSSPNAVNKRQGEATLNHESSVPPEITAAVVTEITLATPFIFEPTRGVKGATATTQCFQSTETELYGYVPQTLVSFMAGQQEYITQYPGLTSCLPAGPTIIRRTYCSSLPGTVQFQTVEGGDLTRSTVLTVHPAGQGSSQIPSVPPAISATPVAGASIEESPTQGMPDGINSAGFQSVADETRLPPGHVQTLANPESTPIKTQAPHDGESEIGAAINSIIGGAPALAQGQDQQNTDAGGNAGTNNGNSGGIPVIIPIAQPVTVPAVGLPSGLGSTTVIDGTPFIIIEPTRNADSTGETFSTTTINGTPFLYITEPTGPGAPGNFAGSTTLIDGKSYIIIQPTVTSGPATPSGQTLSTTIIDGTPYVLIPGPTTIPVAGAPAGLTGSTTIINGTPYIVVPSATSVPALPGYVTIIDGSTFGIFSLATTVPVLSNLSLKGSQTVISGTTMVVFPGATTVQIGPGETPVPNYIQVASEANRCIFMERLIERTV
ncbi:hypothetical protein B0O99DRAFT_591131 [Bisporella sp. PMI_857]|nr:hypothetical protein B0O99DRAFT_591131 [Bisporella sp. PMI_857]